MIKHPLVFHSSGENMIKYALQWPTVQENPTVTITKLFSSEPGFGSASNAGRLPVCWCHTTCSWCPFLLGGWFSVWIGTKKLSDLFLPLLLLSPSVNPAAVTPPDLFWQQRPHAVHSSSVIDSTIKEMHTLVALKKTVYSVSMNVVMGDKYRVQPTQKKWSGDLVTQN